MKIALLLFAAMLAGMAFAVHPLTRPITRSETRARELGIVLLSMAGIFAVLSALAEILVASLE